MEIERPSRPPVRICAVGRALPENYADQETLIGAFRDAWAGAHFNTERLEELHRAVKVGGRYLALPLAAYRELNSFARRNEAWTRAAVDLGETAIRDALRQAGLSPADVDHLFFVTTTGIATPSIDARLVNRLGLRRDVRRPCSTRTWTRFAPQPPAIPTPTLSAILRRRTTLSASASLPARVTSWQRPPI